MSHYQTLKLTLHMSLEIAESCEALVAAAARERFETGVCKEVCLEVAAPTERFAAVDTLVRLDTWESCLWILRVRD